MCLYRGPSRECAAKTILRGLTPKGKATVLAWHNLLRSRVARGEERDQPAAANMRELVWDPELEEMAQRWADQCTFGHGGDNTKLDGTRVGQNVFMGGSSAEEDQAGLTARASNPVERWYEEVQQFSSGDIQPFVFRRGAGHYTQLVWASTHTLGCASAYFRDGRWFRSLVVCNYGGGGNLGGAAMYTAGPACSSCPAGTSCVDSLCRAA